MSAIPIRLGPAARRLYAVHHPAAGRGRGGLALLVCNPWGAEALRAHRSLRVLADSMARSRWHVMRFDYHGTGDSSGGLCDGSVDGWVSDIRAAAAELRALSGASRVVLAGLRLGASLAALAAADDPRTGGLVLWDPVASGAAWLEDLMGPEATTLPGTLEVDGLPMTAALRAQLATITPERLAAGARGRVLVLSSTPSPGQPALRRALAARVPSLDWRQVEAPPAWVEQGFFGPGPVAAPVIQTIAEWGAR
ncbi:MAG: alpha/beta hydrolase [Deltaproteobacteria bacterium]|nr:alpha/beta hydrolase [Deltaproteobacteria bacterium]MCB9788866.1 alpha/beta hydrolase [Deltaproteobacteria bacterium]